MRFVSLASAILLLGCTRSQTPGTFTRTYSVGEKDRYTMTTELKGATNLTAGMTLELQLEVTKIDPSTKAPTLSFSTLKQTFADSDTSGAPPKSFTSEMPPTNLPKGLQMKGNDYCWMFLCAVGYTPGGDIVAGKEFPIDWDIDPGVTKLSGKGKIVSVDTDKKTFQTSIKTAMTWNGNKMFEQDFVATLDLTTCCLLKCTGKDGPIEYTITKTSDK